MITHQFDARGVRSGKQVVDLRVQIQLNYDEENDPLAVEIIFDPPGMDEAVTWTVARDLLVQATNSNKKVGEGDIRFQLDGPILRVCLKNPFQHADFYFPSERVRMFLRDTVIPAASASVETYLDAFLEELLG